MTITEISPSIIGEREKFLLYGEPGMSKTFTALTAPEPIFFLAVGGPNEAKTYYSKQFQEKHGKKKIYLGVAQEQLGSQGRVESPEGFDNACRLIDEALEDDAKGTRPFETLLVDNATVLTEYQMYKSVYIDYQGKDASKQDNTTYVKYMKEGLLFPYDSDWGGTQSLMRKFVSWLFRIDKHIVFVAHEWKDETQDRATRTKQLLGVKPAFIGKDRDMVANMFDNVWHFSKNAQFFQARTEAQGKPFKIIAKSRVGGIVPVNYQNPDLSKTIELYRKHSKEVA